MAEAVRKSKFVFLRLIAKLLAYALTLFGVLSSCGDRVTAAYGIEGVSFYGSTLSSQDSSGIAGIQVKLSSADSSATFGETVSDSLGSYALFFDDEITLPDSIRLTATDIDGPENGSFLEKDTLLYYEESQYGTVYRIDLHLQEDDE